MRPARLSAALIAAVSAKNLDGVNFDFEGEGSGDQKGLTRLITQVSAALHAANPHWQVTMATYASSAADPGGFYDIAALAPAVDGFFVMAYDMNNMQTPSPTAPLVGGGYTDTEALQQFTAVVPPQKVILGVPYYGYDWPTTNGTLTAQATGGEIPAQRRRRSPRPAIPPTGTRSRRRRGPRIKSGPSGTKRSSTTRRPWR